MNEDQRLIDAIFEMVLTVASHSWFENRSQEEIAAWVRVQLKALGYDVVPMGTSHGVLVNKRV